MDTWSMVANVTTAHFDHLGALVETWLNFLYWLSKAVNM